MDDSFLQKKEKSRDRNLIKIKMSSKIKNDDCLSAIIKMVMAIAMAMAILSKRDFHYGF